VIESNGEETNCMGCRFDERLIHLYVDGELGANAKSRVEDHLQICDECRDVYESLVQLKSRLAAACESVKAPDYLKTRISALCDKQADPGIKILSASEKLKLGFLQPTASRIMAVGFVLAAILVLVLIPSRSSLNSMAGELAKEHKGDPGLLDSNFISTTDPEDVQRYLRANLEMAIYIPPELPGGMTLEGVEMTTLSGKHLAHIRYSDGSMECSLFIMADMDPSPARQPSLIAADTEFETSSASDVNFVCWHKDKLAYILCGCCRFERLAQLAVSTI
jgi:hypothetical protein